MEKQKAKDPNTNFHSNPLWIFSLIKHIWIISYCQLLVEQLICSIIDLFLAGSETTSSLTGNNISSLN